MNNTAKCFGKPCKTPDGIADDWFGYKLKEEKNCGPDGVSNAFDASCVKNQCTEAEESSSSAEGHREISCATQAAPFFEKPKGYKKKGANLLLANGQYQPTLTITANTWVRVRLGLIASRDYL